MNSSNRIELIQNIAELCERYPHWRLGQLLFNVAGWADVNIWDVEDHQLLAAAKEHLEQLSEREEIEAS
jgi:hypothetical protein